MELKKILDKFHDKITPPSSVKPSPTTTIQQQRLLKERKITKLSKWRDKWGGVAKSRVVSNNVKDSNITDTSCPSSIHEPTITMSSPTILQRPQSTIVGVNHLDSLHQQQQEQRPTSYTPAPRSRQSRLSVPYVVDHLRSLDVYSSDDTGSFYNAPLSPPTSRPPRPTTWYQLSYQHNDHSISSIGWTTEYDDNPTSNDCHSPVFIANQATTSMTNETLIQQHKRDLTSQNGDHPPAAMPRQDTTEIRLQCQLVTMNVATTMMMMREKQLEIQMEQLRMKNQQLEQQMEDVVSGTWTSTTQLIEENDRLESQIRQLQQQQQQRRMKPPSVNGNGGNELYLLDEQEALRHTRAQLGLVEYLEGEPDVMEALNRFKKLLASSC